MKLMIHRGALVEGLTLASGVVLSRTPKPVLTCVKLQAGKSGGTGTLNIVATDMEMTLQYSLTQVDIAEEGMALIPAAKLNDIVNNAPDDTLAVSTEQDKTTIQGGDSLFKIFGYNPDEFPPIVPFEGEPDFSLPAGTLKNLIDRTRFAAAREMSRYAFNGVLFERKGKTLSLVATDGNRLALTKAEVQAAEPHDVSVVVPIKAINLLDRLLTDPDQVVGLQFKENRLFARITAGELGETKEGAAASQEQATAFMSTSLVEGAFPPYEAVIPKDSDKKVTLGREQFASAVRRAALLTNEESRGVRLSFSKSALSISSRSPEMGEAKIDLPVDYDGEDIAIGFNPAYLTDALKVCETEEVTLEMKSSNKQSLMRSGTNFLYVIMPVSLG